jgi:membrane-bound lytic murein transglycosylase D
LSVGLTGKRFIAPLAVVIAGLAGCATSPSQTTPDPSAPVATASSEATAPAAVAPATSTIAASVAAPVVTDPRFASVLEDPQGQDKYIDADPRVAGTAGPDADQAVAGPTAEQYSDVFDRIRAGFKLDDTESRRIDEQLRWYANNPEYLERVFGRASLYLHHIVAEIEARGMPLELALLPVVESAFEPYARSWATANGLWQFMPGTGERFGLKQNWWYDGRRDVIASTRAALDYLQYMHDEFFNDWQLAIAGYNCGEFRVQRAIAANRAKGLPVDFFSLQLPAETRAYVPKLMAMARLVANPEQYGIAFSPIANEPYFERVDTDGQIDLGLAAELAGIKTEELFELNAGFHRWATDPSGPHFLLLPRDSADAFRQNLALLSPDERVRVSLHKVKNGESIASIAKQYKTQAVVLRDMNNLGAQASLVVGSELRVPSAVVNLPAKVMLAAARVDGNHRGGRRPSVHVVRSGDSLWGIAKRHRMSVATLARLNGMGPGDTLRAGQRLVVNGNAAPRGKKSSSSKTGSGNARTVSYKVRSGDTLSRIAKVFGVTVSELVSWNGISARANLKVGQKLKVNVRRH